RTAGRSSRSDFVCENIIAWYDVYATKIHCWRNRSVARSQITARMKEKLFLGPVPLDQRRNEREGRNEENDALVLRRARTGRTCRTRRHAGRGGRKEGLLRLPGSLDRVLGRRPRGHRRYAEEERRRGGRTERRQGRQPAARTGEGLHRAGCGRHHPHRR